MTRLDYSRKRRSYHAPYWNRKRVLVLVVLLLFAGTCGLTLLYEAFATVVNAIYRATR